MKQDHYVPFRSWIVATPKGLSSLVTVGKMLISNQSYRSFLWLNTCELYLQLCFSWACLAWQAVIATVVTISTRLAKWDVRRSAIRVRRGAHRSVIRVLLLAILANHAHLGHPVERSLFQVLALQNLILTFLAIHPHSHVEMVLVKSKEGKKCAMALWQHIQHAMIAS